ncbi:hypothetical protein PV08_02341 [Exophiala spinifera]|uniref:Hsp70 family chaperone n=1 Tax=Exophiala spinifera TaxID=91928 RepID=A0A0D2C387_9EURO|nr:uncharacterized protein PV08_02341 [Exophiala spinifera]KIW18054.1 hypothetical protein PV08_02341 [Exophiala spinifera]
MALPFSSAAYAFASERTVDLSTVKPSYIRGYPSSGIGRSFDDQVPTVSLYLKRGDKKYEWGNGVRRALISQKSKTSANTPLVELVKLLLSDTKDLDNDKARIQSVLDQYGVSITRAIADFLHEMWRHALSRIAASDGEAFFESCQKDLVLSVPPAWSPNSVRIMQQAAELAELPEPDIVAEQEAAALSVLMEQGLNNRGNLQIGDIFVVVDAGGGTVDLAAYLLEHQSPFRVSEVSTAEGGLINLAFRKWFRSKLVKEKNKYPDSEFERLIEEASSAFEWAKRAFDDSTTDDPFCEVPGLKKNRDGILQNNLVSIPRQALPKTSVKRALIPDRMTMLEFFDQIILDKIIPLITEQIQAVHKHFHQPAEFPLVKSIILVGGFSASAYLRKTIRNFYGSVREDSFPSYKIEIRSPESNHETAVARGSVLRSLNPHFVGDRCLRTSYGIAQQEEFDPKKHDERFKEQDEHEDKAVVNDCILWVYKAGDSLEENKVLDIRDLAWTINADYDFKSGNSREEFFCQLYMSDEKNPKDHWTLAQMRQKNLHIIDRCRLEADFSTADVSCLEEHPPKKGGRPYYKIPYTLRSTVTGVKTDWQLIVPGVEGVVTYGQQINIAAAFKPGEAC